MGVINRGLGVLTPICEVCGVRLCWDISEPEYNERPEFWDNWCCQECAEWRQAEFAKSLEEGDNDER